MTITVSTAGAASDAVEHLSGARHGTHGHRVVGERGEGAVEVEGHHQPRRRREGGEVGGCGTYLQGRILTSHSLIMGFFLRKTN